MCILDPSFQISNNAQRKYLAWQSNHLFYCSNNHKIYFFIIIAFDLLRIDINCFNLFCQFFLNKYPGYYIVPIRITGSAVESLFSQFKYSAGGKLDASNYTYSRGVSLVKQVTSTHHSGKDYRNSELKIPSLPLTKKDYNKKS